MRSPAGVWAVEAPARFLRGLFDWCDGSRSLDEVEHAALARWGPSRFGAFVQDMLSRGVLIDGSRCLESAFDAIQLPSRLGRSASEAEWEAERLRAPSESPFAEPARMLPGARTGSLARLLHKRHSSPGFGAGRITASQLGELLYASNGVVERKGEAHSLLGRRTIPSAGAFKRLRLSLLLVRRVGGFEPGSYAVVYPEAGRVALRRVAAASSDWCRAILEPHRWLEATGLIVASADTSAAALKYRSRALQFALIEAGAALQNAGLAAAELGVGFRVLGGYHADRLSELCASRGGRVLGCAVFGAPRSEAEGRAVSARTALKLHWAEELPGSALRIAGAEVSGDRGAGIAWGRSEDAETACAIAVSEAVERYSYATLGACVESTLDDLPGAVPPPTLVVYARSQYRRESLGVHAFVPGTAYLWARATEWASGRSGWVPAECVYSARALPAGFAARALTRASSSGCATDARIETAIERAAFEVIERDALARHWLAQSAGIGVRAESCPPGIVARVRALERQGCTVSIQVLEQSLGPVMLAHIESETIGFAAIGTACGAEPAATLARALTEAEVVAAIRLRQDRAPPMTARDVRKPIDHADLHSQRRHFRRARVLTASAECIGFKAVERRWPASLQSRLEAARAIDRVLWVDLSRADAPLGPCGQALHTARVLIRGATPIGFGYDAIPRGNLGMVTAAARFPHPLA